MLKKRRKKNKKKEDSENHNSNIISKLKINKKVKKIIIIEINFIISFLKYNKKYFFINKIKLSYVNVKSLLIKYRITKN
jgi:hypothetical protein